MAVETDAGKLVAKRSNAPSIWDEVAPYFNQNDLQHSNYMPGRDNFENIWPVLHDVICNELNCTECICPRICDFGCGTGNFAEQLSQMKFQTFACDISKEMVSRAQKYTRGNVVYEVGSLDFVQKYSPFKLICAIMVFQFVYNLRETINTIVECLDDDGLLFFAIHHVDYVCECAKLRIKFRGIDHEEFPTVGNILIGNRWIETYIRGPEWYDNVLSEAGLVQQGYSLSASNPPHETPKNESVTWSSSKYYIAWYKKRIQ